VEYVNGGPDTRWGRRRAEDGHPAPYHLKYIQIGNEESVDQAYLERFSLLAEAIWSKDPSIIPVVGDFAYNAHIDDPYSFEGAPRIRSLAVHRQILQFAKKHGKPAWFDVHIWNHDPRDPDRLDKGMGMYSFIEALKTLDDGADFKVCVFEENATNHCLRRGLAHAHAINEIQRSPYEIPILCAANCLQPDGQNDNGWDQGLLFLNQSKVWPQPSYYVTQMLSQSYQPLCVESYTDSYQDALDVTACKSADGKTLSVHVVNLDRWSVTTEMTLINFTPHQASAQVLQIKGDLNDRNTADKPDNIVPTESRLPVSSDSSRLIYTFPAYSLTIINFE
jgi:alpha-L-arabinofuranosidase